ncbi:hypothetical protein [Clostridium sp. YIM B02551]|uniref:hypothetical protein n=1 Tax=Clostridium sp. YIM B02551 TaxID=2910679 RepID=UPI001EEAB93F|nr:hypothetical protein [Clostridium sp. YIM B02551]
MSEKTHAQEFISHLENLDESLKSGTVATIVEINGERYPKLSSTTFATCICEFTQEEIILKHRELSSFMIEKGIKTIKTITYKDISSVELGILRKLNTVFGGFPATFLKLFIEIKQKDNTIYSFECSDFEQLPIIFNTLKSNNVTILDPLSLNKLYNEKPVDEVTKYLHENYEEIVKDIDSDRYTENLSFVKRY